MIIAKVVLALAALSSVSSSASRAAHRRRSRSSAVTVKIDPEGRLLQEEEEEPPEPLDVVIIGGGLAGLYAGWRLLTADENIPESISPTDDNVTVAIYEMSDRVGGSLLSVVPPDGIGGDDFSAEFGDMHFPDMADHLTSFVTSSFDIPLKESPLDEGDNLCYLRGQHVRVATAAEDILAQEIYKINWLERNKNPYELLKTAVETVVPNASELTETEWRNVKETTMFDGQFLYELSLWNVLSTVMSAEAYQFCVDSLALDTLLAHQNAAVGLHTLSKYYTSKIDYVTPTMGMEALAEALRAGFEQAGGSINLGHQLVDFESLGEEDLPAPVDEPAPGDEPAPIDESPPGDEPLPPGDEPLPPGDEPLPPGDEPLPPGDEPLPPGDEPLPPGDEPLPPGDEPLPPGDEPLPGDETTPAPTTPVPEDGARRRRRVQEDEEGEGGDGEVSVTDDEAEENPNTLYQLNFANGNTVQARRIILALPKRSLELLRQDTPFFQDETVQTLINSVEAVPASKLFLCYPYPWWKQAGVEKGRSITDQGVRQTFYYDRCILASYTDGASQAYWSFMEPMDARTQPLNTNEWGDLEPSSQIVQNAQRQLRAMHDLGYIPEPTAAGYMNWAREPFGGEGHVWRVGVRPWEVQEGIRKPMSGWNVHIIGEAYSPNQRMIEGDFESAELLLHEHFFAEDVPGTWDSSGSDIVGDQALAEVGRKVSASSSGRRIAVASDSVPEAAAAEARQAVAPGNKGHVQVYDYVGTDDVGVWTQNGVAIEPDSFSGGSSYIATLSGDGETLVVGVVMPVADAEGEDPEATSNVGYLQAFKYQGHSNWTRLGDLIEGIELNILLGQSLALDELGRTLAVGAPQYNDGRGRVHLFALDRDASDRDTWTPFAEIDGEEGDGLGESVSLSGDGTVVAAGAPQAQGAIGYAAVYRLNNNVLEERRLEGSDANERFGTSLALSEHGEHVAVGAPGVGPGRAVVYHDNGDTLEEYATVAGDNDGDNAGFSVDLSQDGTVLALGIPGPLDGSGEPGKARVFSLSMEGDSEPEQIGDDLTGDPGEQMGYTVSASSDGQRLVVGAPTPEETGTGQVRAFSLVPEIDHGVMGNETDAGTGNETDVFVPDEPQEPEPEDPELEPEVTPDVDDPEPEGPSDVDAPEPVPSVPITEWQDLNTLDAMAANGDLKQLVEAIAKAELDLAGEGPFTIFAPTDTAFQEYLAGEDPVDLSKRKQVAPLLQYHIVPGQLLSETVIDGAPMDTLLEGSQVTLNTNPLRVNNYVVSTPDIVTANGLIHKIDSVLIPGVLGPDVGGDGTGGEGEVGEVVEVDEEGGEGNEGEVGGELTLSQVLNNPEGEFTDLFVAFETAGMVQDVLDAANGDTPFTVFAPTDDALAATAQSCPGLLTNTDPSGPLATILRYHVIPVQLETAQMEGESPPTLQGETLTFTKDGEVTSVNAYPIMTPDIVATNGRVHGIGNVLIPPSIMGDLATICAAGGDGMGDEGMGDEGMGDEGMGDEGMGDEGMGDEGMGDEGMGEEGMGEEGMDGMRRRHLRRA